MAPDWLRTGSGLTLDWRETGSEFRPPERQLTLRPAPVSNYRNQTIQNNVWVLVLNHVEMQINQRRESGIRAPLIATYPKCGQFECSLVDESLSVSMALSTFYQRHHSRHHTRHHPQHIQCRCILRQSKFISI